MDNVHNSKMRLSTQEEIKFRNLTNKILNQQSQKNILSDSEKKLFFELLEKLELTPKNEKSNAQTNENFKVIILSLSMLSFYILFLCVPVAISLFLNLSSLFIIYNIVSTTLISIMAFSAFLGKLNWGTVLTTALFFGIFGSLIFLIFLI